jgi:hypothetical protein
MIKLDYRAFVEKLLINNKGKIFNFKNLKINLKSISQKRDYSILLNDKSFYNFYKKFSIQNRYILSETISKKYAKIFSKNNKKIKIVSSFKNILNYFYKTEFGYNLSFLLNNVFSKKIQIKSNNFFFCFAHDLKHIKYANPIFKKLNIKCIFIVFSNKQRLNLKLKQSETILLPNISFLKNNFLYDDEAIIKLYLKSSHKLLNKYRPKFILTVEGDQPFSEALALVSKKLNIKTVCLQWGVYPGNVPRVPFMNMSYDYFISWGPFFSRQLKRFNKKTNFLNFGNFNFINKRKKKNKALFVLQPPDYSLKKEHFQDLYKLAYRLAKQFKNWKFVIRDHPNYKFKNLFNDDLGNKSKRVYIEKYYEKAIDRSLSESKFVTGIWSSSLLEGLYYQAIPCVLQVNRSFKYFPDFKKEGIGLVENDIKKMELQITKLIRSKKKLDNFNYRINQKNKIIFSEKNGTYSKNKIINFLNKLGKN